MANRTSTSESIREFSLVVEEAGSRTDTSQALVAHVQAELDEDRRAREAKERWRRWWQQSTFVKAQTNDDDDMLQRCKEVTDFWRDFSKKPKIRKALENAGVPPIDEFHPPTIQTLEQVIQSLEKTREDNAGTLWGRTKAHMIAFANTMNGHKELFSLFPSDTIYTSVLSGAVSTIFLAFANDKKISEGFSMGLRHIGDNLDYLSRTNKDSLNTPHARKAVANAYVEVFKFLCNAMRWQASLRSRLATSLHSTFYDDHIKSHVDEVERLAKVVDRETNRQTHEGVVNLLDLGGTLSSSEHQRSTADRFRKQDSTQIDMSFDDASKAFSRLGHDVMHCLTAVEQQHDYDVLVVTIRRSRSADASSGPHEQVAHKQGSGIVGTADTGQVEVGSDLDSEQADPSTEPSGPILNYYARKEIEVFARPILPFVNNGLEEATMFARQDAGVRVSSDVLNDIQRWIETNTSSLLWVEGSVFPSDISPVALRVWAVMADAGIPSICFFDQQRYSDPKKLGVREASTVCLLYTVINQVIQQMPSVIETEDVMDDEYFGKLDGSWESTVFALDILHRLLSYAPNSLVLVIHGLESLEGKTTRKVLGKLLDVIRKQSSTTIVKAFFSTNGMSQVLGDKTKGTERVDASRMGQARPGRPLSGGGFLNEVGL